MKVLRQLMIAAAFVIATGAAGLAGAAPEGEYAATADLFRHAGQSAWFFQHSYGYAVFPTISKGALVVGGAHGSGHVYVHGKYVGDSSVTQVSVGLQAGGEGYSQIVFFEDKRSFDEFTNGNFEFDAGAQVTVITASAGGDAGTSGTSGDVSGGKKDANTTGSYYKGMAVFTIVKGGALASAAIAGQKYSYKPRATG